MIKRKRFDEEMANVLGFHSPDKDHVVVRNPRTLGEVPEEYVVLHEEIHRLLINGTLTGMFERCIVQSLARAERVGARAIVTDLQTVITKTLVDTCTTHEAAACYVELCNCAADGGNVEEYVNTFSAELASAVALLIDVLDLPYSFSPLQPYQWITAVFLAKLALNGPVLHEFADPSRLTPQTLESFSRTQAPDTRFRLLCSALQQRGGLAFVVPRLSEIMTEAWQKVLNNPPVFSELRKGLKILDLRYAGGLSSRAGILVVEHAEHTMMRVLATCLPSMTVVIGADDASRALTPFIHAWAKYPNGPGEISSPPTPVLIITPPGDPRNAPRERSYSVRFKVEEPGQSVTLDELREFLVQQAADGRMTLAGFLEIVGGGVAVFAAAFEGFDRTTWAGASGLIPTTTLVARMDVLQVMDFILLRWETEPYTTRTAWHLPLEVAHTMWFSNIGLGLHGTLLRSWATASPHGTVLVARDVARSGRRVHVRAVDWAGNSESTLVIDLMDLDAFMVNPVDLKSKAIVLQTFDDHLSPLDRLPCSPNYISWLGTASDLALIRHELADEPGVSWEAPAEGDEPGLLQALLEVAYGLKDFLGSGFPVGLVPIENPYLDGR